MSDKSLCGIYSTMLEESWGAMSMRTPPSKAGVKRPDEVSNQYTKQQVKIGEPLTAPLTIQTFEQEEEPMGDVSISEVLKCIREYQKKLNPSDNLDRTALSILAQLQKSIKKL